MENPNHSLQRQQDTHALTTFDSEKLIHDQQHEKESLVAFMVAKWIEVRKSLLQMPDSLLPTEETVIEEAREMKRLLTVYSRLTPKQFSEAIRKAAREKARWLSENPNAFPKLYCYDIEDALQAAGRELLKEKPETLLLNQNVGGNIFWGEPAEALTREWPKIADQTRMMRATINPKMRDRFWFGGSYEQKEAAVKVLRQMVLEMNNAGKWDLSQHQYEANAVFATEFYAYFPQFANMTDGMKRPLCPIEVAEIRAKLQRVVPDLSNFPDIEDCKFCAVFDAYWKFKGEK